MSRTISSGIGKPYGLERVCRVLGFPRSTIYAARARESSNVVPLVAQRRGPKPKMPDADLLNAIRADLAASPFIGEGHRKVWARLRILLDIRVSRTRVLRLMRENALLSPHRRPQGKSSLHDGTITTSRPNEMWGTDGVRIETVDDGWVWVFSAIDHCDACCVGIHAVKTGNRFAALQPIAQGLLGEFGGTGAELGRGLTLRMDSNNVSTSFSSARPATEVVRPPEGLVPRSVPDGLTHALIDLSCCLSLDPSAGREHRTARFHLAAACDPRRA